MNGPTAAVVIFFLLMCVKCLLLSLTPFLRYDTHKDTDTDTHTHTHTHTHARTHTRRLVYTSKTRVIPRTFNGFQKVYFWCSLLEGKAKFGEHATHHLGKTVLHTCSDLFIPGQNFSHLFPPVHTCSHLFTRW